MPHAWQQDSAIAALTYLWAIGNLIYKFTTSVRPSVTSERREK